MAATFPSVSREIRPSSADASGERLRAWPGLKADAFYDPRRVAILPMGFCYPGSSRGGDLPRRPECAQTWRQSLVHGLKHVQLTLVIGRYAADWHLPENGRTSAD